MSKGSTKRKVIIDTDAGVDDATAIFLALAAHNDPKSPFEIVAITTVVGNTYVDNVCRNVFLTLGSAGVKGIPVYRGAAAPLIQPFEGVREEKPYHGHDGFGDADPSTLPAVDDDYKLEEEIAQLALIRLAREHKGEVTILALGPLTNLAVAVLLDPDFTSNVKDLYIMGGNIHSVGNATASAEYNFYVDPEAALKVLSAPWKEKIVLLPWETARLSMRTLHWRQNVWGSLKSKQMNMLNLIEEKNLILAGQRYGMWISADPICTAVLLNPKIVLQQTSNYCTVELHGQITRAQMVVDHRRRSGEKHNVTIIEEIDTELLEKMLMSAFDPSTFDQQ